MINAVVNDKCGSRALLATQNRGFVSQEGGGMPPLQRLKTTGLRNVHLVRAVLGLCVAGEGRLAPPLLRHKTTILRRAAGEGFTADMSAV